MPQNPLLARVHGPWVSLLTLVLVVGLLWVGKAVLLPLALGIILAFMLSPLVRLFDRLWLPRFVSVTLTMVLALGAVGGVGYVVFDQFTDLSAAATKYTSSMRRKVAQLKGNDAAFREFTRAVDRVTEQLDDNFADLREAQLVRVVPPRMTPVERLRDVAATVFEPIASAFIVIVLVAFMLGQREDLRDRFIRLIGADNVTLTTRLLDEAGHRVSQFLVWQTLINIAFGALVTGGLYWIGVPYAALWGGLTAVLRFVPYVGTALAALIPALLAFATFPGWTHTLQTLALFATLDLITAYFVEPVVFGQRTGVSSFALLVSALFWIWVWGPVGLLLATPLTVCIAVLGRHVRSLRFLAVIFADEPALAPHVRFYQRLLARDEDEASAVIDRQLGELGRIGMIDQVLLPTVALALDHHVRNDITDEDVAFVLEVTGETLQEMALTSVDAEPETSTIVGLAAHSAEDRVLLQMVRAALEPKDIELIPSELSPEHAILRVIERRPALVCLVAISATRGAEIRNYCRRIRSSLPGVKIVVVRPNVAVADTARSEARMKEAGADRVVVTTGEALEAMSALLPETPDGTEGVPVHSRPPLAVAN